MAFFGGGGASVDLASPSAIGSTTPNTGAFTTLSANNGTITTSSPAFTLAQTWNAAGTTFTALRVNATDTASASGSLLMDLQVGGSSRFSITKAGKISASADINSSTYVFATSEVYAGGTLGSSQFYAGSSGINLGSGTFLSWTNGNSLGTRDTFLYRDAANIIAQRNSTNAQTFRLYNTFTDASNYERGFLRWASNVLEIGAEAAGTGTQRQLRFPLGTVTASTPLSITQTWNSAGVTFTGLQLNATDTASAAGSLLMNLQVGGTSRMSVRKDGRIFGDADSAISLSGGFLTFFSYGTDTVAFGATAFTLGKAGSYTARLDLANAGGGAVSLTSDAASIFAQRSGTTAQTFRIYRTFTDASNYERLGFIATRTTRFAIAAENAGTGAARSLEISFYTSASDPASTDITDGCFSVWKNSGTGTIKLWANDGGTMKSVALA